MWILGHSIQHLIFRSFQQKIYKNLFIMKTDFFINTLLEKKKLDL